jgi:hypothetical protein
LRAAPERFRIVLLATPIALFWSFLKINLLRTSGMASVSLPHEQGPSKDVL